MLYLNSSFVENKHDAFTRQKLGVKFGEPLDLENPEVKLAYDSEEFTTDSTIAWVNFFYLLTLTLSCVLLLVAGMTEPGVIPRNIDPQLENISQMYKDLIEQQDYKTKFFINKIKINENL